jgi:hypothetical protein
MFTVVAAWLGGPIHARASPRRKRHFGRPGGFGKKQKASGALAAGGLGQAGGACGLSPG